MKNAKRILLFALALVALTLVMSLSIFAEETTEPACEHNFVFDATASVNSTRESAGTVTYKCNNEGCTETVTETLPIGTFYVSTSKEFIDAVQCGSGGTTVPKVGSVEIMDGDIIRFVANIDTDNSYYYVKKAITIDLYGYTLTTDFGSTALRLYEGSSIVSTKRDANGDIVKGTLNHTAGTAAIKAYNVNLIANIIIDCSKAPGSTITGIAVQGNGYVESIENVVLKGTGLTQGIEIPATASVNKIDGVEVKASNAGSAQYSPYGAVALKVLGTCNSVTNATLYGTGAAILVEGGKVSVSTSKTTGGEAVIKIAGDGGSLTVDAATVATFATTDINGVANENGVVFAGPGKVSSLSVEGYEVVDGKVSCAGDHNYVAGTVVDATCEADGYTIYICKGCSATENRDVVAALGHSYNAVVTEPTCTEDGYTTYTCSCGDTYTDNIVAKLGHNYVGEDVDGTTVFTCTNCGDSYTCVHVWVETDSADVTCTTDGYIKSECSECGETKTEITEKAEGHTYDWHIVGCPKCGTLAVLDEGSTNVSSNLGYTIFYATSLNDLSNTNYDVIRLKNNISLPSGGKITNANAIIDLGGNVLYRNGGWLGLRVVAAKGFVNGYVYKTNGGSQIMAVTSIGFMEDVTLAANSTSENNATGLIMNTAGAYLGSMKNVTICAGVLADLNSNNFDFVNVGTNGIYNHGIELGNKDCQNVTIGSMENVKISTYGQAITSFGSIGTMTNCVFSGDNIALNIQKLHSEMKFVNCEIHSKNLAIYVADAVASTEEAPVTFDIGNTKFVTDGAVYDISSHISSYAMFNKLTSAKALVNGQLYTSLEDAVKALKASTEETTTFALIADLAVDSTIVIDKKVNFSFGGASYDVPVYGTNQVTHKTVSGYTVTSSVDVVFQVVEGGNLTISGAGTLIGGENAIVANGGNVLITAGTYVGFNPQPFVATTSCVVNDNGTYTITAEHDYDDEVGADKTTYGVDGVCNVCGYVRGVAAVDYVYYATLEEAFAAAIEGKTIVLAADIVINGDAIWDLTGKTFNYNGYTVTVNGSLSIVGGTFTQDVSEYVSDEYCTYKNDKNLYVVVASHNAVAIGEAKAPTCTEAGITAGSMCSLCNAVLVPQEEIPVIAHSYEAVVTAPDCVNDGYTTYTCKACGNSYVDNYVDATGHNYTEETVEPTCTEEGYVKSTCSVCGEVAISDEKTPALGHSYVEAERVPAEPGVEGKVTYTCSVCGDSYSESIEALPEEHTHTPVEIPAVPSVQDINKVVTPGKTSGVMCADCGTILVAPADVPVDFAIPGLAISLTADINAIYRVTIPKGYKDAYMTFKLEGLDEVVVTDSFIEGARTVFQFQGLKFYMMNEEITATVYATTENGQTAILNHSTMSVKFYATQIFKNYASVPSQQKLITLISDLLIAGDMTQIYHGHDVNNLVSDAVKAEGYTLKPTKALADVVIDSYSYGYSENNDRTAPLGWNGMQLVIENSVVMLFKFNATGAALEGLQIKVTIGNNAPTIYNLTDENISYDAQGRCVITVNNIKAKEYGETVKVSFVRDGVDVVNGPEAYLSINAYLSLQQNSTAESGKLKNITRALYNYGQSVYAYEN